MSQAPTECAAPPIDEAGWGQGWIVWQYLLQAAAGVGSVRVLGLATVGLLIAEIGVWGLYGFDFEAANQVALMPGGAAGDSFSPAELAERSLSSLAGYWLGLASPFWQGPSSFGAGCQQVAAGLWRLATWSLFGVAIARAASLHLTHHDAPRARSLLGQSAKHWRGQLLGPLVLLGVVGALLVAVWGVAQVGAFEADRYLAVLLMPLAMLLSLLGAVVGVGAMVGTPLIWAAYAVEHDDPFDAVSCGLAYTYQRPMRLLAYTGQAVLIGVVLGAVVLAILRIGFGLLGTYLAVTLTPGATPAALPVIQLWAILYDYLPTLFHAAYFWHATVAVYLLMRRDIDEKQVDEIRLDTQFYSPQGHSAQSDQDDA